MKYQDERRSNTWVLGVVAVWVFSTWFSLREFRYFAAGRTVEGTIMERSVQAAPASVGARRGTPRIVVKVRYQDARGVECQGRDEVPMAWSIPEVGGTIQVEYLPGLEGSARLAGNRAKVALAFWFGSLGALIVIGLVLARESRARQRKHRRRSKDEET